MIDPIPFFSGSYILPRTIIGAAFPISKKGLINLKKLTKQIISIALGAVTAASCGTMAFAADKTLNQDTPSGSSTVEYSEETTYTATIPAYIKVQKMSENVDTNANSVTLRDVIIPDGKSLVGTVTYNDAVAEENNVKIPYKLATAEGDLTSGSTIITQTSGKSTEEKTSHFGAVATEKPKYSGYYTDTATFSFDTVDKTYSNDEINNDTYLYYLGRTKPEYVVAKFNADYSSVEIIKNGEDSDGIMGDLVAVNGASEQSFYSNQSLVNVTIKDGVKSIGDRAFAMCQNLKSVSIPKSVTSIGSGAFAQCTALTDVTIPANTVKMGDSVFDGCTSLETVKLPEKIENLEEGTPKSRIRAYMFKDCHSLKSVTLPNDIEQIDSGAFMNCKALTSVEIPDSVQRIAESTFKGCSSLKNVTLPNNDKLNSIACVFIGCSSLESVTVPDSVTDIDGAFTNCVSLKNVNVPNGVTQIGSDTFSGCAALKTLNLPSGITIIGKKAFSGCSNLTNFSIPSKATLIYESAFEGCSSIKNITIPEGSTGIGNTVFKNCSGLTSVTIPSSVIGMYDTAFQGCSNLNTVYGTTGSYAETWAKNNGYTFVAQ